MQTLNTLFERELSKQRDQRVAELKDNLAAGHMSPDDYKFNCGLIRGLTLELDSLIDGANEILSKR